MDLMDEDDMLDDEDIDLKAPRYFEPRIWTGMPQDDVSSTLTTTSGWATVHHAPPYSITTADDGMVYTTVTRPTYYPASSLEGVTWDKYQAEKEMKEDKTIMSSTIDDPITLRT